MVRMHSRIGILVWLVACCGAVPIAAGQQPSSTDGVVVVRGVDSSAGGTGGGSSEEWLGFLTVGANGDERVVTSLAEDATGWEIFALRNASGQRSYAERVGYDPELGFAVLELQGSLSGQAYQFVLDQPSPEQEVSSATLQGGQINAEYGIVVGTVGNNLEMLAHNVFRSGSQIKGAPLLNRCNQIVGVARETLQPNTPVRVEGATIQGNGMAVPAARVRDALSEYLGESVSPCGSSFDRTPEDAASEAEPGEEEPSAEETAPVEETLTVEEEPAGEEERVEQTPAAGPGLALEPAPPTAPEALGDTVNLTREQRRLIQLGLAYLGFDPGVPDGLFGDATRAAIRDWQTGRGEPATGYLDARVVDDLLPVGRALDEGQRQRLEMEQREAEEVRRREEAEQGEAEEVRRREEAEQRQREEARLRAEQRVQYILWGGGAVASGTVLALLFWVFSRRSVANAARNRDKAEMLARSAQADLSEREAQERMASAVPAVFLDGADAAGEPVGVRVPGNAIAAAGAR